MPGLGLLLRGLASGRRDSQGLIADTGAQGPTVTLCPARARTASEH